MGGKKAPDYKARVSGVGAAAKRTDMSGGPRVRHPNEADAASGLAYGERRDVIAATQAVDPTPGGGSPAPAGPQAGSDGTTDPRGILSLLTEGDSQRPGEDVTAGAIQPTPSARSAAELAFLLEEAIGEMPSVSSSMLNMLTELKREARYTPQPPISLEEPYDGEGPVYSS